MMDFKGWKKIKEDKDTTTMKHDKGHTMTLANKAMPKIQREQLKRLPIQENSGVAFYEEGAAPVQASDANPPAQLNQASMDTPPTQTPSNVPLLNTDQTLNAPAAINLQQKAAREQEAVDISKGIATANMEKAYNDQRTAIAQRDQDNYNDLKGHTDDFKNYIAANPINPNHYQENMGAGEKVASAFGLLMGGFKQGFSGGSNPAMDYLNGQIQRDIDAQKARSENQKTVYGAYEHLYGDANIANNLTKVSMNDIYAHKALQIAAGLATPQAMATANAFAAQKGIENQQLLLDSAGRRGQLEVAPNGQQQGAPGIIKTSFEPNGATPQNESETPILNQNAQQHLDTLRYTPKAKEELDQIKGQYTQAQMADNLMSQLHDVHQKMYDDAINGGTKGYLRRHDPTSNIPFAGNFIAGVTSRPYTDLPVNRDYDANKTRIVSDIANALKGTNVSGEEIQHIVDVNSPEHGDSPEDRARKERNIRVFIKNSVPKSLLKDWGLAK